MAVKPIIIPLVADTTGLEPGIDALEALGKVDSDVANQFRAANKAFQDRGKVLDQSVTSTEKFAAASKKLVESITGGAIAQATANIKKLTDQVDSANAEFITLTKTISLAKQELAKLQQGTPAFEKLSQEIQAAELVMGKFEKEATSSRAQLRQYREALNELEEAGLENTRVFQDMAATAGQLQDQIGDTQARIKALASDTFKFDAAIQAVQGVAGAFSIAQGAAALFGDENEELQKTLLKVNAAMSILNGLQQIQNLLQKQTALSIATELALQKVSVLQTNLQAAAESRFIVVRYAAAAAQRVLNAVMAANPAGVVLFAIAALATALVALTSRTDESAKAWERMNGELETYIKISELSAKVTKQQGDVLVASLEAQGASSKVIREAETQTLRQQVLNAKDAYDKASADLASYGNDTKKLSQEQLVQRVKTQQLQQEAAQKYFDLENELQIKRLTNQAADNKEQKELADKRLEELKKAQEAEKKAVQDFLRDQVAANEAAVIEARDGFERLVAQIALINAKLRQELANGDLGPNERLAAELRAGDEIKKARQELLGDLERLQRDYNTRLTQLDRDRIQQGATLAQEELERKRQNAEEQKKITEDRIKREQELEQRRVEFSIQTAASLAGSLTEIYRNNADAQIAIEQQRLEQGLITQEQFDQKSRAIRRRAAQQEKEMALFQAALAQSLAILSILKDQTIPAPSKPLFIALASAQALAQLAAIASKPIPQFAKGTKSAPGGPSIIGEAGPELFYANGKWGYANQATLLNLPKGAKVIPTLETEAILQKYNIPMPNIAANISTTAGGMKIDYNKLGSVIGREIGKLPLQFNSWDERGFSSYQTSISNRASHLRTKFRSPGK